MRGLVRYLSLIAIISATLSVLHCSEATVFHSGRNVSVPQDSTVKDDLAAVGRRIDAAGKTVGNIFLLGAWVNLSGTSSRSSFVAGRTIMVSNSTGDDLMAAGADVDISGKVANNAGIAGGQVTWATPARVGRDLHIAGGSILVQGDVGRNLTVAGGDVSIDGKIGGNAVIRATSLTVGPDAVIKGNLTYDGENRPSIRPGAKIMGKTVYHHLSMARTHTSGAWNFAGWLLSLFAALLVGLIVTAIAPRSADETADKVLMMPIHSVLIGFIVLVMVPIASIVLMLTVIGIPLGLITLIAYLISLYVGPIFVGLAIGRSIFRGQHRPNGRLYLDLIVGLVILWLLCALPVIGGLIKFLSILLGLGSLAYQRHDILKKLRSDGLI